MARLPALRIKLFADFGQIHLRDPEGRGELEAAWTAQASEDRVADGGDIVGIGAADTHDVMVEVEVLGSAPAEDKTDWQHITECSVDVTSGAIAVIGCTDVVEKAKRMKVAPGTWRARISHAGLDKGGERMRIELWRAPREMPRVLHRWVPPAKGSKVRSAIKSAKQAVEAARRGDTDGALEVLLARAAKGDVDAASSAVPLLAFRARYFELVPLAMEVLTRNPEASAGRARCWEMCALLRRASKVLRNPKIIDLAVERLHHAAREEGVKHLQEDRTAKSVTPAKTERADFAKHAQSPEIDKRFRDRVKDRANHLMAVARVKGLDDELLALWDPSNERMGFEEALAVARILVARGDDEGPWKAIESRIAAWWPRTVWEVAPVVLLVDPQLVPLMTPARCEQVLSTPRADQV